MLCGSFTQGEGDEWSDIDLSIAIRDEDHAAFDEKAWVSNVAPLLTYFKNEYSVGIAIYENLVRAEFHFDRASNLPSIRNWPLAEERLDVDSMILLDRTGELTSHLQAMAAEPSGRLTLERVEALRDRFLNWFLFGLQVLRRGDRLRSLDTLSQVQRHLLWLARVIEGKTDNHFLTPSKNAEHDLSPASVQRFSNCVATVHKDDLLRAYQESWAWYVELTHEAQLRFGIERRQNAMVKIAEYLFMP
jgi:lincosamide nucleotidyltransferase